MSVFRGPIQGQLPDGSVIATAADVAQALADAIAAQGAAESAQQAAEAALESFDDRYLGPKTSDPTVDNDGDPLADGALYFNTTDNAVKVYDLGSDSWLTFGLSSSELDDISAVNSISTDVTTVAGISTEVTAVASDEADIGAVSTNIADVSIAANNIIAIQNAPQAASDAQTASSNALISENNASSSASDALTSEQNAATSESNALTSEQNAAQSESNAETSEINASNSASAALTSEQNAANSASAAQTSEDNAETSEINASNSASAASTSESNALTSEQNAATSESNALTSEQNASNSASAALTSEQNASNSADAAATSEQNASDSEQAAQQAATDAETALDNFTDQYLGVKASDPATDNDGDTLLQGTIYYNSTDGQLRIYDGVNWQDAAFNALGTVTSFNGRDGAVSLTSSDVTNALAYTPYDASNPDGYISDYTVTSTDVTTALGYTPLQSGDNVSVLTNDAGYISDYTVTSNDVTTALGYTPYDASNPDGYISDYTVTSTDVTTALGYTPQDEATAYDSADFDTDFGTKDTGDLNEGAANLYYTDARARNALSASGDLNYNSTTGVFSVTVPAGYDSSDFDTDFSTKSTDDLSEGTTNLYYANSLVESYLSGGTGINYSSGTISHEDTSSQASVSASADTFVSAVTLDTFGHVTGLVTDTVSGGSQPNDAAISVSAGTGLTGGGTFTTDQSFNETITVSHSDTSSQGSVNNSGSTVIQDISVDGFGHITDINSKNISASDITIQRNDLPSGSILQVVESKQTINATISSTNFTNTGLSASINPTSSSNDILVMVTPNARLYTTEQLDREWEIAIYEGGTAKFIRSTEGLQGQPASVGGFRIYPAITAHFVDSPGSTFTQTYEVRVRVASTAGSTTWDFKSSHNSVITLMEIKR